MSAARFLAIPGRVLCAGSAALAARKETNASAAARITAGVYASKRERTEFARARNFEGNAEIAEIAEFSVRPGKKLCDLCDLCV
jgi:hypothetical protein